jgi:hypothetical protein
MALFTALIFGAVISNKQNYGLCSNLDDSSYDINSGAASGQRFIPVQGKFF